MIAICLLAALELAREPDFREFRAVQESLAHLPPKLRGWWLHRHGYDDSYYTTYRRPETMGLRLVGKWGRGPSVEVTGRDSLVVLTLGSEVALINFADPDNPEVLTEIQLDYIPRQSLIKDSLLFTGGNGIQLWDITNPRQPVRRSVVPYGVSDFAIRDTFLFFIGNDSFQVFSFADPASPYRIGCYPDSGNVTSVTERTAVIMGTGDYIAFADISDPVHPHRVGYYGGWIISATARNTICCVTIGNPNQPSTLTFRILDISNPATPLPLSSIDSCGAYDIFLDDSLAFLSGYYCGGHEFRILSIRDSTHPRPLGICVTPDVGMGVWADSRRGFAFVADDFCGLGTIDIADPLTPALRHSSLKAGLSEDIDVQGNLVYVAQSSYGLKILDATVPSSPEELAGVDSTRDMVTLSAVARDSFAYMGWGQPPYLRSIDVTDPRSPRKAGSCAIFDTPRDMVLRDSFLYVAQAYRFQVVNVARPRQPVLVGSCNIQGYGSDVVLQDSLAYVSALYLTVVNVARPDNPRVVFNGLREVQGLDVVDTIAFLAFYGLKTASVSNPIAPYILDSVFVDDFTEDVVIVDTLAILGGRTVRLYNIADPRDIRLVGAWKPPGWCYRLVHVFPYIYAACWDAGICILETATVGIHQSGSGRSSGHLLRATPSVTTGKIRVMLPATAGALRLALYNVAGGELKEVILNGSRGTFSGELCAEIDLAGLPAGVYLVKTSAEGSSTTKVVKTVGR
ncbi:MAG: hypothetical protein ABIK44_03740 [candidate division WOR-3 bacterium]